MLCHNGGDAVGRSALLPAVVQTSFLQQLLHANPTLFHVRLSRFEKRYTQTRGLLRRAIDKPSPQEKKKKKKKSRTEGGGRSCDTKFSICNGMPLLEQTVDPDCSALIEGTNVCSLNLFIRWLVALSCNTRPTPSRCREPQKEN